MLYCHTMISIAEKAVPGGYCIARPEGKAVFVTGALPGETVDIEIVEDKKKYSFAKVISVLEPSHRRVTPPCPFFGVCGGCSLQMADQDFQREIRLSLLQDCLDKAAVPFTGIIGFEGASGYGYRSRFQFHRDESGKIGFKHTSDDTIVPVNDCLVAQETVRQALSSGYFSTIPDCPSRFHVFSSDSQIWSEPVNPEVSITIGGKDMSFDVRGFFQSNIPLFERLLIDIFSRSPVITGPLLDFYSGVGTFSLAATGFCDEVVLVEHNRSACQWAQRNLEKQGTTVHMCAVSDDAWPHCKESRIPFSTAIVDPPRSGISKTALDWFIKSSICDLRYVSCDPVTFSRDAAVLCSAGFHIESLTLYDFYPQTHHLESFGRFIR